MGTRNPGGNTHVLGRHLEDEGRHFVGQKISSGGPAEAPRHQQHTAPQHPGHVGVAALPWGPPGPLVWEHMSASRDPRDPLGSPGPPNPCDPQCGGTCQYRGIPRTPRPPRTPGLGAPVGITGSPNPSGIQRPPPSGGTSASQDPLTPNTLVSRVPCQTYPCVSPHHGAAPRVSPPPVGQPPPPHRGAARGPVRHWGPTGGSRGDRKRSHPRSTSPRGSGCARSPLSGQGGGQPPVDRTPAWGSGDPLGGSRALGTPFTANHNHGDERRVPGGVSGLALERPAAPNGGSTGVPAHRRPPCSRQ